MELNLLDLKTPQKPHSTKVNPTQNRYIQKVHNHNVFMNSPTSQTKSQVSKMKNGTLESG